MVAGSGFGGLLPVAMVLVGVVTLVRARARRRSGDRQVDADAERRQAETALMERRMAAYLAGRDTGRSCAAGNEEQENGR